MSTNTKDTAFGLSLTYSMILISFAAIEIEYTMFRFGDPGGRVYTSIGTSGVNLLAFWSICADTTRWSVSAGNGRNVGSCLRYNVSTGDARLWKVLDSQATWGVALALRPVTAPTSSFTVLSFYDSATTQVDLRLNADLSVSVTRNGTVLGTVSPALSANAYYHLELKVTIHPTAGTVGLWINSIQKLNLTSQNTRNTANSSASAIVLMNNGGNPGGSFYDVDDIIVYDGQANDPQGNADIVGPIGDCALTWLLPTGAGTTTQFTPDSGSNYARVNEATPDGDTSYVADATVNDIDTYALADLGVTVATVKSVMTAHFARKDDVGTRSFVSEIRTASTNFAGSNVNSLSSSYQYYFNNWGSNPSSLAAWSVSDINGLEIGQKVNS